MKMHFVTTQKGATVFWGMVGGWDQRSYIQERIKLGSVLWSKSPLIAIYFLGINMIKCQKYHVEQMMSDVMVRGIQVSDENKHTRESTAL